MASKRTYWFSAVFLLLVVCAPFSLKAQGGKTGKMLAKARQYYEVQNYVGAEELYSRVISDDPTNYEAAFQLGRINNALDDYREALNWYRKAVEIDPNRDDEVYYRIGLIYKLLNNYRKAKESFETFKEMHAVRDELYERAELEIAGCELAEAELVKRPNHRVQGVSFNSSADDQYPVFLDQRQQDKFLAFVSGRPLPNRRNKVNAVTGQPKDRDLYYVVRENDTIFGTEVTRFPYKTINFKNNDGPASFTGDGLTMYFTICNAKKNKRGCSIYESKYNPLRKQWSKPLFLESLVGKKEVVVNSRGKVKQVPSDDLTPHVTPDGRTLFFVSDRPGGQGGFDIWYSRRVGAGWSPPQNLGPVVNSPFNEVGPFTNYDGDKLYYTSDGLGGFGGYDIYEAEGTIGEWGEPQNMGSPINTTYNDLGLYWMPGDSMGYFSSDRTGGVGGYDIYWAQKIFYDPGRFKVSVKGLIRDKYTKQPIPFATAILYEYTSEESIIAVDTFYTDQDARYEFPLVAEKNYKILGNSPDYFANEEELSTMGIEQDMEFVRNIDIELEPIIIDSAIVLQNIYYDFDKYYLRQDALPEVRRLLKIMVDNPNIVIELGSHTDSNGRPNYNKELSNNRARAVVKYLADNGIDPSRLAWLGYGEGQPLVWPEVSPEDEQANRRTEFKVTSIDFSF
ncbi:OmpA family protein [Pontibacter sp. G13]|uniref:OmpA family protein n=1 Tax=Pontibacter sp. G13 TaxID=3074898 RepID=UPI00288A56D1|nr:OmpA family protein [Pontibacter sp. G13]WNJ20905.1 OmpA family protein [Pontibacter sp. G13]